MLFFFKRLDLGFILNAPAALMVSFYINSLQEQIRLSTMEHK